MFARKKKGSIVINDDGTDITIRFHALNHRSLEIARVQKHIENSQTFGASAKAMGPEAIKAMFKDAQSDSAEEPSTEKQRQVRYDSYEQDSVIASAFESWDLKDSEGKVLDHKGPQGLTDLEPQHARQLHEAILDLSLPALEVKVREQAAKNDSGPSIES